MVTGTKQGGDVAEIQELFDERLRAIREKDIATLAAQYVEEVVSFDVVNPLRSRGAEAIRGRLREWFASFEGAIDFEIRDLRIAASGDVAFCYGLSGVRGTTVGGGKINMWYRTTVGLRKTGGKWLIAHEHDSVPFDVRNGKASLELQP